MPRYKIEILQRGTKKIFGTLISFFRSFISFFRTFISFFRTFISTLGEEFLFAPWSFPIPSEETNSKK